MDELFTLHPNGLFLRRDALEHGYRDRDLVEARRYGAIARVRHGTYMPAVRWAAADAIMRHRFASQGVLLTHGGRVALSHTSGAIAHGLRLWTPDLDHVHVTRLSGNSGRSQAGVVYHQADRDYELTSTPDGLCMIPATDCALGAAAMTTVQAGLPILDSLLNLGFTDTDALWAAYQERSRWPFSRTLQVTVRLARPGAESLAESLCRHMMWCQHLPEPELQYCVYDEHGELIGVCDFAWPLYRLLGEFDGKFKYGRLLKDDQAPGDVVYDEKVREDALREITGFGMIRYLWGDIYKPAASAARTRRLMRFAA